MKKRKKSLVGWTTEKQLSRIFLDWTKPRSANTSKIRIPKIYKNKLSRYAPKVALNWIKDVEIRITLEEL